MAKDVCVCGDNIDDHGHDPKYPGSTACKACDDCLAFEAEEEDNENGSDDD